MTRDASVITQIGITHFDHFVDRIPFVDIQSDTMYGKSLLLMSGDQWRVMRSNLAPAFTGSKMRNMFGFVRENAFNFTQSLIKQSQQSNSIRSEMRDLFSCFASEIMASSTMGLEINSVENPTNGFLVHGKRAADFSGLKTGMRILLLAWFPWLMRILNFEFVPQRVREFFKSTLLHTMDERTKRQIFRPDIVNTLMTIRNERLKSQCEKAKTYKTYSNWTDDELAAQCFCCFVVGFDTLASVLAFMAYEVALNQEIQQKLYEEVRTVNESLGGGHLTYDALSKLKYLDQVIDETLRKWPPVSLSSRKCTKDVELDLGNSKNVRIEQGTGIWIPVSAVHYDPKNFVNPSKFDPERFSEENEQKIKPGSYIPFGIGPRQCPGMLILLGTIKTFNICIGVDSVLLTFCDNQHFNVYYLCFFL